MDKETYNKIRDIMLNYWATKEELFHQYSKNLKTIEDKKHKDLSIIMKEWNKGRKLDKIDKKQFWNEYRKAGRYYGNGTQKKKEVEYESND